MLLCTSKYDILSCKKLLTSPDHLVYFITFSCHGFFSFWNCNTACVREPFSIVCPVHSKRCSSVGLMMGCRLRRWTVIKPTLDLMFSWMLTEWSQKKVRYPANTRHTSNAVSRMWQCRRLWPILETALVECLVFASYYLLTPGLDNSGLWWVCNKSTHVLFVTFNDNTAWCSQYSGTRFPVFLAYRDTVGV